MGVKCGLTESALSFLSNAFKLLTNGLSVYCFISNCKLVTY